jgi:hypothetical protein
VAGIDWHSARGSWVLTVGLGAPAVIEP